MGRPTETGRTSRHKCGSKPLESLCVCGLHHAANPWANHGESEEMRQPWAFCSFFPLWSPQTQARLLFSSLPAQLWPLGLQRPPLGPSQEFLPSSGDGLRTHFQPKVDLSAQEEQLWGPNTGTLQILKKRVYTFYIFFDSRASGMELYPDTAGRGTGQPARMEHRLSRRWPQRSRFPWLYPQSLYPRFSDTPGPRTTQEETLQPPPDPHCYHSRGFMAA